MRAPPPPPVLQSFWMQTTGPDQECACSLFRPNILRLCFRPTASHLNAGINTVHSELNLDFPIRQPEGPMTLRTVRALRVRGCVIGQAGVDLQQVAALGRDLVEAPLRFKRLDAVNRAPTAEVLLTVLVGRASSHA